MNLSCLNICLCSPYNTLQVTEFRYPIHYTGIAQVSLICILFMQAPTARQVKYKEKVQELRKKKDTGLSKEQKEKYMVCLLFAVIHTICVTLLYPRY